MVSFFATHDFSILLSKRMDKEWRKLSGVFNGKNIWLIAGGVGEGGRAGMLAAVFAD